MSSSKKGQKPSKTTETQTSIDEGTEQDTPTHFDTSKTGQMRKREWTRKVFASRPLRVRSRRLTSWPW